VNHERRADICVRADLPRLAGVIDRSGADYFWTGIGSNGRRLLIPDGQTLAVNGSARLTLHLPSVLCESAVLTVSPPHRFDQHVDAVVLANETLLVGPNPDCHIRCREAVDRTVLIRRGDRWMARIGLAGESHELQPGRRTMLKNLAITLEEA
jgi:hypothetical protein